MPNSTTFYGSPEAEAGQAKGSIYDETGMVAIEEFANRLQTGIVPDGVEWARFEGSMDDPDEFRAGLSAVQRYMFKLLSRSNFGPEVNDAFKDLSGYGNAPMRILDGDFDRPVRFQAIPLADAWVTPGPDGRWADVHVRYRLPAYAVKAQFGEDLPKEMTGEGTANEKTVEVYDSWIRDLDSPTERWWREVHVDGRHCLRQVTVTGTGSCEYLFARWSKGAGSLYGQGQGMMALPAMEVVNEAVRLILAHGELALAGIYQAEDDGVLNPHAVQLVPGAVIPIAPGSKGLQALGMPTTRLDIGNLVIEEQRHAIRKALYNETMGAREGTPPTALEIQERMAELARSIGPAYGRVWHEFVVPLVVRVRFLLERRGLITMPLIDGRKVKIAAASSLVRAAAGGDVRRINEWIGGIAAHYGPAAVASLVPADRYMRLTAERMDIPADLPFSPTEINQNAQAAGQMLGLAAQSGAAGEGGGGAGGLAPLLAAIGGQKNALPMPGAG